MHSKTQSVIDRPANTRLKLVWRPLGFLVPNILCWNATVHLSVAVTTPALCDQSGTSSWLLLATLHADPQRTGFLNTTSVRVMDVQLGNLFGPYWNVSIIVTNASTTLLNLWHLRQSWSQKGAIYCTMGRKWVTGGSMTSGSVLPVKPGSCFFFCSC